MDKLEIFIFLNKNMINICNFKKNKKKLIMIKKNQFNQKFLKPVFLVLFLKNNFENLVNKNFYYTC